MRSVVQDSTVYYSSCPACPEPGKVHNLLFPDEHFFPNLLLSIHLFPIFLSLSLLHKNSPHYYWDKPSLL